MTNPTPQVKSPPWKLISVCFHRTGLQGEQLLSQTITQTLIRVQTEDPVMGSLSGCKVLLVGVVCPVTLKDTGTRLSSNDTSLILAARINHDNFIGYPPD